MDNKTFKDKELIKFWNYLRNKLRVLDDNNKTAKEIYNKLTGPNKSVKAQYSNKVFIVSTGIYPFDILFLVGHTNEEAKVELESRMDPDKYSELSSIINLKPSVIGHATIFSSGQVAVRFISHPISARARGTVAHEIFHAATFILERVGIQFDMDKSDEAFAYLIGYITEQFYEKLEAEV